MAKFEATQGQWKRVVGKLPGDLTAELPEGNDYPVGNVNFAETETFCRKLTDLTDPIGRTAAGLGVPAADRSAMGIRLPRRDDDGDLIRRQAQQQTSEFQREALQRRGGRAVTLAKLSPSAAIPPMLGDCTTCMATSTSGAATGLMQSCPAGWTLTCTPRKDRTEANGDISRVRRGGCWTDDGWPCRSAFRLRFEPERRYDHIGFRIVIVQVDLQKAK